MLGQNASTNNPWEMFGIFFMLIISLSLMESSAYKQTISLITSKEQVINASQSIWSFVTKLLVDVVKMRAPLSDINHVIVLTIIHVNFTITGCEKCVKISWNPKIEYEMCVYCSRDAFIYEQNFVYGCHRVNKNGHRIFFGVHNARLCKYGLLPALILFKMYLIWSYIYRFGAFNPRAE